MANYQVLISSMEAVIKENGQEEITGVILQNTLRAIIQTLGAECQFGGVVTPDTNPGTLDYNVAYIGGPGTYPNLGGVTVNAGYIGVFSNKSGSWAMTPFELTIADNAVTTAKIANDAVETAKIKDKNVTMAKLADAVVNTIMEGNVFGGILNPGTLPTGQLRSTFYLVTQSGAYGSISVNESEGFCLLTYDKTGASWSKSVIGVPFDIAETLEHKADIDGFYMTLGAGVAANLMGRGSVPAEYTFRTAGGSADIGSGTATITRIKGNTIDWNQQIQKSSLPDETIADVAFTNNDDGSVTVNGMAASVNAVASIAFPFIAGRKYYIPNRWTGSNVHIFATNNVDAESGQSGIFTATNETMVLIYVGDGTTADNVTIWPMIIDLSIMGIADNINTEADFKQLFPLDYYAYNAGSLLSLTATGINTVGFNQWDEVWEIGYLDPATGLNYATTTNIRSKNYIPVFPSTQYYFRTDGTYTMVICFYDANKRFISSLNETPSNRVKETPSNTAYIRFALLRAYGTVYKNDICINLSWSGYRNGEYEPYWESELPLPLNSFQVKDGEGNIITINGLKSAGSVFDEIVGNKYIQRVRSVDMGTLQWALLANSTNCFTISVPVGKTQIYGTIPNAICALYKTAPTLYDSQVQYGEDKVLRGYSNASGFVVKDTTYTSAAAFKSAMSGIMLYYELATPIEYELVEPIGMNYRVDDFGTEMELPQNGDEPVTAPIRYDVQYPMNAVDTLRRLPENYISKESMQAYISELDSKLGAALNATMITTMTFDAETQKYGFSITITPN